MRILLNKLLDYATSFNKKSYTYQGKSYNCTVEIYDS